MFRTTIAVLTAAIALSGAGPAVAGPADYSPRIGDTPAEFGAPTRTHAPKAGDTPADFGKSVETPSLVEIVRPERTIVRDTDPALPIVLSAVALILALGLVAQTMLQRQGLRTRTH